MSVRKAQLDSLAISLLLSCCLFWGFQQVLVKATLAELPPVFQASLRFAGATLLLGLWCAWRGVKLLAADGTLGAGLLAEAFVSYLAWMWMLGRYPATRISVFVFLTPLFALLFGALWLKEAVTPSLLAALALVAVGIVLVNRKPVA